MNDDFFTPPAFKPAEALLGLKRQLRGLGLAERGTGFELRGRSVIDLATTDQAIEAKLAKRPAQVPEWTKHSLKSSADLRRFVDAVKQQLARWSDE